VLVSRVPFPLLGLDSFVTNRVLAKLGSSLFDNIAVFRAPFTLILGIPLASCCNKLRTQ